MSVTVHFTEEKMKSGTRRLLAELRQAGVNIDAMGYNKALHVFSKAVLDKPYEEVKGAFLDAADESNAARHFVMILSFGSNDILVVNEVCEGATDAGTDMEIPYRALEVQAKRFAKKFGVTVQKVSLPPVLNEAESDHEWVEVARAMGFFEPQGSIFDHLWEADQIFVSGKYTPFGLDSDWHETLENSENPDAQIIWYAEAEEGFDKYEWFFTFGELKRAKYEGQGKWQVPYGKDNRDEVWIPVSFAKAAPISGL